MLYARCVSFFLHNLIIRVIIRGGIIVLLFLPFPFVVLILCITYIGIMRIIINNNKSGKCFFSGDVAVVIAKTPFSRSKYNNLKT